MAGAESIYELEFPLTYPIDRRSRQTTNPELAAIRGNEELPEIIITRAGTSEGTRREYESERSSTVHDLGRRLRLDRPRRSRVDTNARRSNSDLANDLRGVSGGEPRGAQTGIASLLDRSIVRTRYDGNEELQGIDLEQELDHLDPEQEPEEFIPLDAQEKIITHARVREELEQVGLGQHLDSVVNYVCGDTEHGPNKIGRQIFGILTLIGKRESIVAFKRAGIFDCNLPFRKSERIDNGYQLIPYKFADDLESLGCSRGWEARDKDVFFAKQWSLLSPFFDREPGNPPLYYPLQYSIVLPWKYCASVDRTGGHSEVRKVEIHEAHHGFETERGKPFALKALESHNEEAFKAEFRALKKVELHQHIVPVLAAFKHRNIFYLLFPWAEGGNLNMVWRQNDDPIIPRPVFWVAKQCYGLATALHHIHDISKSISSLTIGNSTFAELESRGIIERPYGRHGDIKPENVLQFKYKGLEMSDLKISDFGLTIFHSAKSRSADRIKPKALSYNPPETTKATNKISRKYDIWCLGCLYLDFITWLFAGFKGVDDFGQARYEERSADRKYKFDYFFKNIDRGRNQIPVVKDSVKRHIQKLQARDDCSDFLFDFLEIIKNEMLVVDEKERIECEKLEKTLNSMVERCHDDAYLLNRSPKSAYGSLRRIKMLFPTSIQALIRHLVHDRRLRRLGTGSST